VRIMVQKVAETNACQLFRPAQYISLEVQL
jgi:hypothetical protein